MAKGGNKKDESDLSQWPKIKGSSEPTPEQQGKNEEGSGGRWSDIVSDDEPK